jgi:hypothetical protein
MYVDLDPLRSSSLSEGYNLSPTSWLSELDIFETKKMSV